MLKIKAPLNAADTSVPMLVTAASVCVVFMLLAGGLVYANTRRTITAADWVEHTQEVLTSLRTAAQLIERTETSARLYQVSDDEARLDNARITTNTLETNAVHLRVLVADNTEEVTNADLLTACSAQITQSVSGLTRTSPMPTAVIQRCQQIVSKMTELERRLLVERNNSSQRIAMMSLTSDAIFVGLSVVTLITVFGFLLRAAELRRNTENQVLETNRSLERSVQLLQDQADETSLLTTSRDEMQLCVTLQEVYDSARNGFARLVPQTSGALCMLNNSRNLLETVASWGNAFIEDCQPPETCCGLRSGQPRWREPDGSEINCSHFPGHAPERYICVPIVAHGDTLGLLYIQCENAEMMQLVRARVPGMRQLTQLTSMAIASMKLRMKLENQSIRDPLTSLFNRNFMEITLERELSRARRKKTMVAIMMLDVDHFKEFNDIHGHAAGDAVLKAVAMVFQEGVRNEDTACRYGGEEFTIILPDITPESALARAESLRNAIADVQVRGSSGPYGEITISIGVAMYPEDGTVGDILLQKADQSLYAAKQQGRNRVILASEPIFAT